MQIDLYQIVLKYLRWTNENIKTKLIFQYKFLLGKNRTADKRIGALMIFIRRNMDYDDGLLFHIFKYYNLDCVVMELKIDKKILK